MSEIVCTKKKDGEVTIPQKF